MLFIPLVAPKVSNLKRLSLFKPHADNWGNGEFFLFFQKLLLFYLKNTKNHPLSLSCVGVWKIITQIWRFWCNQRMRKQDRNHFSFFSSKNFLFSSILLKFSSTQPWLFCLLTGEREAPSFFLSKVSNFWRLFYILF